MIEQDFITVDRAYSLVREELKSYFDTGSVDDSLFDIWSSQAMRKFQGSYMPVKQVYIPIENYIADLPEDFQKVKEAWACGIYHTSIIDNPTATYYQKDCRVTPIDDKCHECFCPEDPQPCTCENIDPMYRVTHKITGSTLLEYWTSHLLLPEGRETLQRCGQNCPNTNLKTAQNRFSISGCRIQTSYREGGIHMLYYSTNLNEEGTLLIPDVMEVEDFLIKYLKFKVLEQVSNQTTDETFNQIERKLYKAEQDKTEAFISAETSLKKKTNYDIANLIVKRKNRLNRYRRSLY